MFCSNQLILLMIIAAIAFIAWQFKMLKKYALKFDRFKIDERNSCFYINKQAIFFKDIEYIDVRVLEQPSDLERALSKSATYAYMAEMTVHFRDRPSAECVFNSKGALYKALKQLDPFVRINENIENYKPQIMWGRLLLILAAIIIIIMSKM